MKARGDSGVDMTQAIDDKVTIVGSSPNIYPSCRTDGAGRNRKIVSSSTTQGSMELPGTYTECEAVDNGGDHHGGSYSMVAMNKFSVDSGGGGISLNSGGNINLMAAGGLANIVGTECVSIISNVIKLVGTEITVFKGPELYVETDNTTFVNSVKMAKNLVVQGGALINGELFINHLTGPQQIMDTSMSPILPVFFNTPTILTGIITQTCINPAVCGEAGPVTPAVSTSHVQFTLDPPTTTKPLGRVLPHKHTYKHVACSFKQSQDEVWAESEATGTNEIVAPKKVDNFGDVMDKVIDKVTDRITNAFIDTVSSLMSGVF